MTNATDERGAEAPPKILGSADRAGRLVPHHLRLEIVAVSLPLIGQSLGASFADLQR
jgi:hypothetical protein